MMCVNVFVRLVVSKMDAFLRFVSDRQLVVDFCASISVIVFVAVVIPTCVLRGGTLRRLKAHRPLRLRIEYEDNSYVSHVVASGILYILSIPHKPNGKKIATLAISCLEKNVSLLAFGSASTLPLRIRSDASHTKTLVHLQCTCPNDLTSKQYGHILNVQLPLSESSDTPVRIAAIMHSGDRELCVDTSTSLYSNLKSSFRSIILVLGRRPC